MGMKVASSSPSLQWTIHHSPQTLASKRQIWFLSQRLNRWSLLGTHLHRSKSCELLESSSSSSKPILRRVCSSASASLDPFSDEEFSKKIQELTLRFKDDSRIEKSNSANRVFQVPISLQMIKKKRELEEGVKEVSESSSMNKAFSSMVFMIRELQSFTLHMREILFYQDLQGILLRVREEMHQSFVWLFQRVFSATPTLMVYVMLLLANFTVYSIGSSNSALAAAPTTTVTEVTTVSESRDEANVKFDSSVAKTFFVNKTTVGGGGGGGGGNIKPVLSGTDGDGFDESEHLRTIIPQGGGGGGVSQLSISGQDEHKLWNSMVEEAERMHYSNSLDQETRERLVSHVEARVEGEEDIDYLKTEIMYQTGLFQEPNNPLLLTNYAQFLYLVSNDHDRAEEYFKRAVGVEPKDAEALSKYATFLWRVRDDLWAAEETFLEAIDADPTNSYYAANYANFLWNTGGDETCFPLDDESHEETI